MPRTSLDFIYEDQEYSLRYGIDALVKLSRSGLLAQIANGERPSSMTRELFCVAFDENHKDVPNSVRRKIYKEFSASTKDRSLLDTMCGMLSSVCDKVTEVCRAIIR